MNKLVQVPFFGQTYPCRPKRPQKIWCDSPFNKCTISHLVYPAVDGVVQYAGDEERLHVPRLNVQLPGYEGNLYPGVRPNQLYQHLLTQKYRYVGT